MDLKDKEGAQQVYKYSYMEPNGTHINMKLPEALLDGAGLSGSTIIDSDGLLVGIVSGSYFDSATRTKVSTPCSINSLLDVLTKLEK